MINAKIKKIIIYIQVCALCMCFLSGCSIGPSVDLTEEQTELISEYAAGLLLKYEKGHEIGLSKVADLDFAQLDVTPTPTPIPTPVVVEEEQEALVEDIAGGEYETEQEEVVVPPLNVMFGIPDMNLDFAYAQICDVYPEGEELLFSMSATEGHQLLIMHFNLTNPMASQEHVLARLGDTKVRALINEDIRVRAYLTFLQNDLTSYAGTLESGQTEDAVIVFEVEENIQIDSLKLLLVNGSKQMEYNLN